jgi:hypothetical protein
MQSTTPFPRSIFALSSVLNTVVSCDDGDAVFLTSLARSHRPQDTAVDRGGDELLVLYFGKELPVAVMIKSAHVSESNLLIRFAWFGNIVIACIFDIEATMTEAPRQ